MSAAAHDAEGLVALVPPHLDHPVRLSDYLGAAGATVMIQRALNCVDSRLVDHGLRVGAILSQNPNIPERRVATIVDAVRSKVDLLTRIAR